MGLDTGRFPAGESLVSFKGSESPLEFESINCSIFDNGMDLMGIAQSVELTEPNHLVLPYVPYARQDRKTGDMCNALKLYAGFINQLGLPVVMFDPHSDVVEAVFDAPVIVDNHEFVAQALNDKAIGRIQLVIPDAGAAKKSADLAMFLSANGTEVTEVHQCLKVRATSTGEIKDIDAPDLYDTETPVVIVDDICDGGRTFKEIAMRLNPDVEKHLIVSHGVFSGDPYDLFNYFASVTASNSYHRADGMVDGVNYINWNQS